MNKKAATVAWITAAIVVIFLICVFVISGKNQEEDAVSTGASSIIESQSASSVELSNESLDSRFKEINFGDKDTMAGRAEYDSLAFFQEDAESVIQSKELVPVHSETGPMKTDTGHQLYESKVDGQQYIVSGYGLIPVRDGVLDDIGFLREEGTGARIRTFLNESERDAFLQNWESGQRILSGETYGEKGTILVDGTLTPYVFKERNGEMYFNLYEIGAEICSMVYYEEDFGYISIYPNEYLAVKLPTDAANEMLRATYKVESGKFEFNSWWGDSFSFRANVLDYRTLSISARDASRMLGWRMYTDGNVLHIVSDPLNVNNNAIVYNYGGSMGYKVVLEYDDNGKAVANTYDSTGRLISSSPYEPIDDSPTSSDSTVEQDGSFSVDAPPPQITDPDDPDALPPGWSV